MIYRFNTGVAMSKLLIMPVFIGILFVISLIILSILANMTGWSGGAEKILTAALICAIPVGSFFAKTGKKT